MTNIAAKILFNDKVKFISGNINSNKFIIYYSDNNENQKIELPLNLFDEFIYIDNEKVKCPICDSQNIISEKISNDQIINDIINDIKQPKYINDPIPDKNWECLNCGSTKESLENYTNEYNRLYKIRKNIKKCNGDLLNLSDKSGYGKLSYLQIRGKRYLKTLHWFRVPFRLLRLLNNHNNAFINTIPKFKWVEKDRYLYLEYIWYLDGEVHIRKDNTDVTRICNDRYLRPPKKFNRDYLKYKYPDIWTKIDADFKWQISGNYVEFKIYWDKQKYKIKCLQENGKL